MSYRDLIKMTGPNDGTRSLVESIMSSEVIKAYNDWIKTNPNGVLIGGLALSYYVKPRFTQDVDFLFLDVSDIPNSVTGFKRHRPGAFQHNTTHVEVEVVTGKSINASDEMIQKIFDTAVVHDGVKIASPSGLVALKLGRLNMRDKGDIVDLINCCEIDLSEYPISENQMLSYEELVIEAEKDINKL